MATVCDKISEDLLNNCENKPVAGVTQTLILINKDDVSGAVYDTENPQVIRDIFLNAGARAYSFEVYKNTHKPRTTSVNRTYGTYQKQEIPTAIMTWDIATKVQVEAMLGAKLIAIAQNQQTTGDARFEVYGWDSGLTIAEGAVRDTAANDGIFNFTLANEDEYPEPHLPKTYAVNNGSGDYSFALTNDSVNELLIPSTANANLSALTISSGTLTPAFAAGTISYTDAITNGVTSVTVTPTVASGTSTVKVNGATVTSGSPSGSLSMVVGTNTILIEVTAPSGLQKVYTIVVTRAAS